MIAVRLCSPHGIFADQSAPWLIASESVTCLLRDTRQSLSAGDEDMDARYVPDAIETSGAFDGFAPMRELTDVYNVDFDDDVLLSMIKVGWVVRSVSHRTCKPSCHSGYRSWRTSSAHLVCDYDVFSACGWSYLQQVCLRLSLCLRSANCNHIKCFKFDRVRF